MFRTSYKEHLVLHLNQYDLSFIYYYLEYSENKYRHVHFYTLKENPIAYSHTMACLHMLRQLVAFHEDAQVFCCY